MSKLKVDQISKATGASPAIFTLPAADGTAEQYIKTDGSGALGFGTPSGGKVLQVLQSVKTDTASTTSHSGTFVDIAGTDQDGAGAVWCVKITPVATTSEILVYYTLSAGSNTQWNMNFLLKSDAASPLLGDAASSRVRVSSSSDSVENDHITSNSMMYLDSPSTVSEVTYTVQWSLQAVGSTMYLNRSYNDPDTTVSARAASTITVMEIGA